MEITTNNLVRLKRTSGNYSIYKTDAFYVEKRNEDGTYRLTSISTGLQTFEVKENIKVIKLYNMSKLFSKLAVGDIVVTNCDGSNVLEDEFVVGKIGEIEGKRIYIWNNKKEGTSGRKAIKDYKYSWLIKSSSIGVIAIIKKHKKIPVERLCVACQEEKDPTTLKKGLDDKLYCSECYDNIFIKCGECDELIDKRGANKTPDGDIVCEECFSDKYCHCVICCDVLWTDDALSNEDGEVYCEECYHEKYGRCAVCEEEIEIADCEQCNGEYYCHDCFSERFTHCDACGNAMHNDDVYWDEENQESYCSNCRRTHTGKNIHDYSYAPSAEFKKMKWEEDLFLGLELEVQHDEAVDKSEEFIKFLEVEKIKDNFYLKHDSSIDGGGNKGFEIVSHPATLHYWHKQLKMKRIIDWLKQEEFVAEESGECGIHIHISRAFFTDLEVAKLRLFFRKNEHQLKKFSRRELEGECTSDPYHYCRFEDFDDKSILNNCGQEKRYWALNMNSSRETIELRFFRATLNYKRFLAILQFSEAISRFVKKIGIAAFIYGEREYKNNSWKLFIDWATEENKYKDMLGYFEKNNIVKESQETCV